MDKETNALIGKLATDIASGNYLLRDLRNDYPDLYSLVVSTAIVQQKYAAKPQEPEYRNTRNIPTSLILE